MRKTVRGSSIGTWIRKVPNWNCLFVLREQGLFLSAFVDDIKNEWKEAEYGSHVEEIDEKMLILTNQLHFLITCIWDVLNVNANRTKSILNIIQKCLNHVFLLEQLKNYQGGKNLAPDHSMPEARGNLQILWPRGSSHVPPGLPNHTFHIACVSGLHGPSFHKPWLVHFTS